MERKEYKYVIIGGGTTGFAALQELLERDPGAKVYLKILSYILNFIYEHLHLHLFLNFEFNFYLSNIRFYW